MTAYLNPDIMQTILTWLRDNAYWFFAGVGVFLLASAVSAMARSRNVRTKVTNGAEIAITFPVSGALVDQRCFVSGTVSSTVASVIVVIHPMVTSKYWVQPKVTVRNDRSWKVGVYVGADSPRESGELFEIAAIATPIESLKEADVLDDWPRGAARSGIVEVQRK